ncbi:MAG: CocE/NonD family hydrolase [Peptococcaceae bacterium]
MFSLKWKTSERKYDVVVDYNVRIRMSDGVELDCDIFRPSGPGKFPAILGVHCYYKSWQSVPAMPIGITLRNGGIESGDPQFFVRRGYAHIILNVRGSGKSGGTYQNYGPREVQDSYEAIEWIANQPWCDGNVGMWGVSYFATAQKQVAALNPPHLKAIWAPFGYTDFYRHKFYHGGILSHAFMRGWSKIIENCRAEPCTKLRMGEKDYKEAIKQALQDRDICAVPYLVEALQNPDAGANSMIVDILLNNLDGPYYQERNVKHENIKVPAYLGACWGIYGLHLPGSFQSWEETTAPKKLVIGPRIYLDRPVFQYQYESLRWFDYWLKGMDTKIMDEAPVRVFVGGTGEWKEAVDWPLPETKWTPFYLHAGGLLSEHEHWPHEGATSFEDNSFNNRGHLKFASPVMVEDTEVIGPIVLNLYAATTDTEVLWFVSLCDIDPDGNEHLLTRGWLRGSQRKVDPQKSTLWLPFHSHTDQEALTPGDVYEFNISVVPTGNLFKTGHRIGLKISCVDDESPANPLDMMAQGHLWRQSPSWVTVFHNSEYPSHLLLPITKGNVIGTYISGGSVPAKPWSF